MCLAERNGSGLLFGCAADGLANPDWLVVPDSSHPRAWRPLHTVSNIGGSRFTVGSAVRYPPGQSDAANKAQHYHFEALHKIYFYDVWRCEPELNKEESLLHLPRRQECFKMAVTGDPLQVPRRTPVYRTLGLQLRPPLVARRRNVSSTTVPCTAKPSPFANQH